MSKFDKSDLRVNGNHIVASFPFAKIDVSRRTVSGYATLDNIDSQGDVVTAEASRAAFERARGNIREMHDKIAAGRIIDFREDEYLDQDTGRLYRGIFVTARISEGAESTWLKVLDGTLSGFSIGGEINEAESEYVADAGRVVRFIKDYDLTELSLVDNPANPLANIFSIQKSASGSVTVEGMVADTLIENVFVCKTDNTIIVEASEDKACPQCETKMENAGWFESGPDRATKVRDIVNKFLSPTETEAVERDSDSEGGVDMGFKKNATETEEVVTPDAVDATSEDASAEADREPNEEVEVDASDVDNVDETEEVDELDDAESLISKKIDDLKEVVQTAIEKTTQETSEKVSALEGKIDELNKSFEKKASELEARVEEFGKKLEAAKSRLSEFEKVLDAVNSRTAVKKSADVEESAETVQKSKTVRWGSGTFSGETLFR